MESINRGRTITLRTEVRNISFDLIDPVDPPTLSIFDPDSVEVLIDEVSTRESLGKYYVNFLVPEDGELGEWTAHWEVVLPEGVFVGDEPFNVLPEEQVIDNLVSDELIMKKLQEDPILTTLVEDRIFEYQAPKGTSFPYIVFYNQTAPRDIRGVGTTTIMTDTLYAIKAIDQTTSYSTVREINKRIHELLHGIQAIVGEEQQGTVVGMVREEAIKYPEIDSGKHYRHLGGLYRVFVSL